MSFILRVHESRVFRCFVENNSFWIGSADFPPHSNSRRLTVLLLITTPFCFRLFRISVKFRLSSLSASATIILSYFLVVARFRLLQIWSLKTFVCIHLFSHYLTVLSEHLTAFATAPFPSFGPLVWIDRNTISYRLCIGRDIFLSWFN